MHLTALSGHHFVHHLFDASIAIVKFFAKSADEKAQESREHSAAVSSRLSVLESQFSTFVSRADLEFATQQELNDWQENQSFERFFIITGVAAAPAKLSGGAYSFFSFP